MKELGRASAAILILSLAFVIVSASYHPAVGAAHPDPCDSYGDCVSATLTYTRANPDHSLYLSDQFSISLQSIPGSGSAGCGNGCSQAWSGSLSSVSWAYDQAAFDATTSNTQADFVVRANSTASRNIIATATFVLTITTCVTSGDLPQTSCSTSYLYSPITISQEVQTFAFSLSFQTRLVNATTPLHQLRRNPDGGFYPFDAFYVNYTYSFQFMQQRPDIRVHVTPSYDQSVIRLQAYQNASSSGGFYYELDNETGNFGVTTTAAALNWLGQKLGERRSTNTFGVIPLIIDFRTKMLNVTDGQGWILRNPDGTFYRNDSFSIGWNASFKFSNVRTDIRINVTSFNPAQLDTVGLVAGRLGRNGTFTYHIGLTAAYKPNSAVLRAEALNFYNNSLALTSSTQRYAVVQYDPKFTSYAYMMYGNSTASSSLQRPWILLVRYDGNLPRYAYSGDENTHPFNRSRTLAERAYFSNFQYATLSYQPYDQGGVFDFHTINSTSSVKIEWLNEGKSSPLYNGMRVEKYVFSVTASSLSPILSRGFIYQNIMMIGCWAHEGVCDLTQNYWLVPFLWSGRLNIVSVDSNGDEVPGTPITLTIRNPAPLDGWLTSNFERVFWNDSDAIKAFEADLYPTDKTMTFSGNGRLSIWLNQTSLSPPQISITAGGVSLSGNITFVPTFVNTTIASVPNSFNGAIFHANATIPLWSYNMVRGSLSFLPISTTIDHPSAFLELVNSSGWIAGNTTAPQTPSAFAFQRYGFWPLGQNLPIYANLQGGGVRLLGTQKIGPNEYQASFYVEPWSGGISSVQLTEGTGVVENESTMNTAAFPSPLPQGLSGLFTVSYPATGQDTKVVFTNEWGATTTIDLGASAVPVPLVNLIPATTATAFGFALIVWLVVSGMLKTRKTVPRD